MCSPIGQPIGRIDALRDQMLDDLADALRYDVITKAQVMSVLEASL